MSPTLHLQLQRLPSLVISPIWDLRDRRRHLCHLAVSIVVLFWYFVHLTLIDAFDGSSNLPYPSPPAPAPGPSLLDDNETNMLDSFFDGMDTGSLGNSNFIFDKTWQSQSEGNALFGLGDDLPPTFYGFSASMPQQDIVSNPIQNGTREPTAAQMQSLQGMQPSTSADVLAAASTLVQNGQTHLPHNRHRSDIGTTHSMENGFIAQPNDLYTSQFLNLQQNGMHPPNFRGFHRNSASNAVDDPLLQAIMFGAVPQQTQSRRKTVDFRYGSDVSFLDNRYAPPPGQETEDDVTQDLMQKMECLEPQSSANNTRPPSPGASAPSRRDSMSKAKRNSTQRLEVTGNDETEVRPKKRRKSTITQEAPIVKTNKVNEVNEADTRISPRKNRGRKGSSSANGIAVPVNQSPTTEESPSKRRKSTSGINRENLSEEQKRNNHILSEQKRRNIIKQGFDDLCELVPELRDGAFSKSAMLTQAGDWLEDLLKGNSELKTQLRTLSRKPDS